MKLHAVQSAPLRLAPARLASMKVAPMSGRPLREKAQRWLELLIADAPTERLAAENRALAEKMALMEAQMSDLKKALDKAAIQLSEKST